MVSVLGAPLCPRIRRNRRVTALSRPRVRQMSIPKLAVPAGMAAFHSNPQRRLHLRHLPPLRRSGQQTSTRSPCPRSAQRVLADPRLHPVQGPRRRLPAMVALSGRVQRQGRLRHLTFFPSDQIHPPPSLLHRLRRPSRPSSSPSSRDHHAYNDSGARPTFAMVSCRRHQHR